MIVDVVDKIYDNKKKRFDKANKFSDNDARMYQEHSADKGIKKSDYV